MQHTAKGIASLGRNGDDTLLHVNKEELAGLQALLGPVTVNPETGLPEAFQWTDILKMLGVGVASAMTGGAATPALGAMGGALVGAGTGAVVGGAVDAASGKGFTKNIIGNALSGAISGYGGGTLNQPAAGTATPPIESPVSITGQSLPSASAAYKPPTPAMGDPTSIMAQKPSEMLGVKGLSPVDRLTTTATIPTYGGADKLAQLGAEKFSATPMGMEKVPITADLAKSASQMPEPGMFNDYTKQLGGMADKLFSKEGASAAFQYGLPAASVNMALEDTSDPEAQRNQQLAQLQQDEQERQYFTGLGFGWSPNTNVPRQVGQTVGYGQGFAIGGPVDINTNVGGTPMNINLPARYADEFVSSGAPQRLERIGFGDVTPNFASGGYINLQPMGDTMHPQGLIPKAQPYPAATPQRREVVQDIGDTYAGGGFIEGPGDGMSDDIDANIEGVEPVRVADGEYRVSARQVAMLGGGDPKKGAQILDAMLKHVRAKAYKDGHRGGQIKQDAGKLAAEKMFQRSAKK